MQIKKAIDIYSYFSSKLSCQARELWIIEREEDIKAFIQKIKKEPKWVVVGRGSNLIPSTPSFDGIVVVLGGDFLQYEAQWEKGEVIAGAAVPLPMLARISIEKGWQGFERFGGIPGSIGGAVVMNAGVGERGRYSVGPFVEAVQTLDSDGQFTWHLPKNEDFSYRHSVFLHQPKLILKVKLKFSRQVTVEELQQVFKENMESRKANQPLQQPNWGSTFINPPGDYAARLIESCGLKGLQEGEVQVSTKHANFFVNLGKGDSVSAVKLIDTVQSTVYERTGIQLQREVRYLEEEVQRMQEWFQV